MILVASCAFGLEAIVARELKELGYATKTTGPGQIEFSGGWADVFKANLWLRCADRVSIVVADFPCVDFDTLFETSKQTAWDEFISDNGVIHVTGGSVKSKLTSVPAVQRTVKKAIVDQMMAARQLSTLPEDGPLFRVHVSLRNDVARLTLDTTGASLHKRGYREIATKAPLKETMAAALVKLSFWRPDRPMIDPFCGGGTILIEAALIGRNIAPGLHRNFVCETWPDVPVDEWETIRAEAKAAVTAALPERLVGSDIHSGALSLARLNAVKAGVEGDIAYQQRAFKDLASTREYGCVVTNPPYGERIDPGELRELYESIPLVLRKLPTWSHYILTSYEGFEKLIGREADRRRKLYNGRIQCTYFQFHGPRPNARSNERNTVESGSPAVAAGTTVEAPAAIEAVSTESQASVNEHALANDITLIQSSQAELDSKSVSVSASQSVSEPKSPDARETNFAREQAPVDESYVTEVTDVTDAAAVESSDTADTSTPVSSSVTPTPRAPRPANAPVFGGENMRADEQTQIFASRLKKRARHLRRWPTRRGITCFRLYERDIPEIPLVVDRYGDHVHITEFERPHDRDLAQQVDWLDLMTKTVAETLEVPLDHIFVKSRQRQKGSQQYERVNDQGHELIVEEGGLKFIVNLADYTDTGLFLDHRIARSMIREMCEGKRVLNLFAYTGSFSIYAAAGGAESVTTVDLSATYLDWAKRNFDVNELPLKRHKFYREDTRQFIRSLPEHPMYDVIVCDPPTFSNSKRTEEIWDVQHHHAPLLTDLLLRLNPGGTIFFSSNFRRIKFDQNGILAANVREISKKTVPEDFRNKRIHRSWLLTHPDKA